MGHAYKRIKNQNPEMFDVGMQPFEHYEEAITTF